MLKQHPLSLIVLAVAVLCGFYGCGSESPKNVETKSTDNGTGSAVATNDEQAEESDETMTDGEEPSSESSSSESNSTDTETTADNESDTDENIPDYELQFKNLEELQELIAEYKGQVVVVDYWSTWCAPCIREFPFLVKLQKEHGKDVVCIAACCNYDGLPDSPPESFSEEVQDFLKQHDADVVNVIMTVSSDELFPQLELASIPAVYVYDRDGKLVKRFDNEDPKKLEEEGEFTYEKDINPLVAELIESAGTADESESETEKETETKTETEAETE